jgi:hypothetical protein
MQLGNIDWAISELLLQQPSYDANSLPASALSQPTDIVQVFVVAVQFRGDVIGERRRWLRTWRNRGRRDVA